MLGALYDEPLPATRTGALYTAFPYPTKNLAGGDCAVHRRAYEAGRHGVRWFAGSGTTGLAALLCEKPSASMREKAKRLGLKVAWGARNAVLYELGALGSFVGRAPRILPNRKRS